MCLNPLSVIRNTRYPEFHCITLFIVPPRTDLYHWIWGFPFRNYVSSQFQDFGKILILEPLIQTFVRIIQSDFFKCYWNILFGHFVPFTYRFNSSIRILWDTYGNVGYFPKRLTGVLKLSEEIEMYSTVDIILLELIDHGE